MKRFFSKDFLHTKCRNTDKPYLKSNVFRQYVPNEKVEWENEFSNYNPVDYTSHYVEEKDWADSANFKKCHFNSIDGIVNRKSHECNYKLDKDGRPLNIYGRTGLRGRGVLGRWGPNHAADSIVSRFYKDKLQFVAIQRKDTLEWAIPGGMVDAGEDSQQTLEREFKEEVLNNQVIEDLKFFWTAGEELYKGYVDDHRNTDNAWMETIAVNFHDENNFFDKIPLKAGDDAKDVKWMNVDKNITLYGSHNYLIKLLAKKFDIDF